jgi:hypothetical protein
MIKSAADRSKYAQEKDKEEIEDKKREYRDFGAWTDKGILKDLKLLFQIENPSLQLLLPIAMNLSHILNLPLGRQEKRRKNFLIGWLNKHYELIEKFVPRLVIKDDKGNMRGPCLEEWSTFQRANPDADILHYLAHPDSGDS